MRLIATALALPLLAGAAGAEQQPGPLARPSIDRPFSLNLPTISENCRDRIERVREERGLPPLERGRAERDVPSSRLDREPFQPGESEVVMIYAVDHEIDGCDVLVMANNPEDVRPLPRFDAEDWRVRPAPDSGQ